jgi:hypothetical protein
MLAAELERRKLEKLREEKMIEKAGCHTHLSAFFATSHHLHPFDDNVNQEISSALSCSDSHLLA